MDVLAAYRDTGSYRSAAEICGTTHKTVRRIVDRHYAGGEEPARRERGHNYDGVQSLVAGSARSGCCRLPERPDMTGRHVTSVVWLRR
jgi:hypothetical protein